MNKSGKLSDEEYVDMLALLKRYSETELDQWDRWKFDTRLSRIYIDISRAPIHPGTESNYTDVDHMLK